VVGAIILLASRDPFHVSRPPRGQVGRRQGPSQKAVLVSCAAQTTQSRWPARPSQPVETARSTFFPAARGAAAGGAGDGPAFSALMPESASVPPAKRSIGLAGRTAPRVRARASAARPGPFHVR